MNLALGRWLVTGALAIGMALGAAPAGSAEPGSDGPPHPYPDGDLILRSYHPVQPEDLFVGNSPGVWFMTPGGLNCGIFDYKGSFGCEGDIVGAPPGVSHIAWYNGNIVVRYDPVAAIQFPPGQAERALQPRSYVEYNGTMCATMADTSTYCRRGPFRFLITATGTFLSPPENL